MVPVFSREYILRTYESDWSGRARPTALLNILQDAAGLHAQELGVSVQALRQRGLTWILSRYFLHFHSYPVDHESVRVVTWPSIREGRNTWRDFEIRSREGELLVAATSSWALLDLERKRPVRLDQHLPDYPLQESRALEPPAERIATLGTVEGERHFDVKFADIDLNHHVNNAIYVEWALETVPEEVALNDRLSQIEVEYRAEALLETTVCARTSVTEEGREPDFLHQILDAATGKELARLRSRWRRFD